MAKIKNDSISKIIITSKFFSRTNKRHLCCYKSSSLKDRPCSAIFFVLQLLASHRNPSQIYVSFIGGGWIIYLFTHSSRTHKFGNGRSLNQEARQNRESRIGRTKITPFQIQRQREVDRLKERIPSTRTQSWLRGNHAEYSPKQTFNQVILTPTIDGRVFINRRTNRQQVNSTSLASLG